MADNDGKTVILNTSLQDLRSRVDTLAKSIFLIAGGAITLSVNLYLNKKSAFTNVINHLKTSWFYLLASILLFAVVIGLLIIQGYLCGEFYRAKILKNDNSNTEPNRFLDIAALAMGILGFAFFIIGMRYLILTATYL